MSEIPVNKFRLLVNEFRDSINYLRKQSANVFSKSKISCKKITGIHNEYLSVIYGLWKCVIKNVEFMLENNYPIGGGLCRP